MAVRKLVLQLYIMIFLSCIMHFILFLPKFWVVEKFLGFFKIDETFAKFLGWVLLKWFLKHHALYYICIIRMCHVFLDVCLLCCNDVC